MPVIFAAYKTITNLILPPGIFVIIFLIIYLVLWKIQKQVSSQSKNIPLLRFVKVLALVSGLALYIISIDPFKDILAYSLENIYPPISEEQLNNADGYILLGGGIRDTVPVSLREEKQYGLPEYSSMARINELVRLYNFRKKPVFLTGGIVLGGEKTESEVYKSLLIELGIEEEDIFMETRSRTTYENALFIKELLQDMRIKKPVLITSAGHVKRSVAVFKKHGIEVIPAPCDYLGGGRSYYIDSFYPEGRNIEAVKRILWEYTGFLYYRVIKRI